MTHEKAQPIQTINPLGLGQPPGYSQVVEVRAKRLIFIAGQTSLDRDGSLVGRDDFATQVKQVFHNLSTALDAVGCTASNLAKLTVYLRRMDDLPIYREERNRFFASASPAAAPAVTLIEVSRLYDPGFLIEIDGIAAA